MIARLDLLLRLITFVAAGWIVANVLWRFATGEFQIKTPLIAVWLIIASIIARVVLWLACKARPA